MTIQVRIAIQKRELPKDYRRLFLHFIKTVLDREDNALFSRYYATGMTVRKPFTFWAMLPEAKFLPDKIQLEDGICTLFLSSDDTRLSFVLYNGFKKCSTLKIGQDNEASIQSVRLRQEKTVKSEELVINMLSPLVVRNHQKGQKDRYLLYHEDGFLETFRDNVASQLRAGEDVPEILPIKCKKVIVPAFGTNIPSSLGVFKLSGTVETLQKLYLIGLGSKNAAGFGKFEIIG